MLQRLARCADKSEEPLACPDARKRAQIYEDQFPKAEVIIKRADEELGVTRLSLFELMRRDER